jgi:hypothetical protein
MRNGSDVTVTSGSTIVFAIAPLNGALIDVIGTVPTTYSSITPVAYSAYLSSLTSSLSMPSNAAFGFGTGDFTIEMWVYITDTTVAYRYLYISGSLEIRFGDSGFGARFQFSVNNGGGLGAVWSCASTLATLSNSWQHIAFTRQSGTCRVFINGALQYLNSGANPGSYPYTSFSDSTSIATNAPSIGGNNASVIGYYSNVRVVKGVAVYTASFNPITSPLTAVQSASSNIIAITGTQTSLLTCNAPTIVDGSSNAFTITNTSVSVSTAFVPTFTNVTINNPSPYYTASYLAVGGGGSGGPYGGGGGAGGFLIGSTILIQSTIYNIVIGAGGAAMPSQTVSGSLTNGNAGTFTSFTSIFSSITAAGGGYGSTFGNIGGNGSSGGGSGLPASTTVPNAGGSGINGQGYAGGGGLNGASNGAAGGGGGGGGVGGTVISPGNIGGAGGVGLVSSITGSSVYYAGGGGGGTYGGTTAAAGGNGGSGGGGGGSTYASGTQGTAGSNGGNPGTSSGGGGAGGVNTGGGGGGGGFGSPTYQAGGAGGSGVVIISVPTANYTARTTGSPTVTTNGIYTVLTFTASGTYTA